MLYIVGNQALEDIKKSMESYVAGEYRIAFEALSPLADEGYANAQNLHVS